ncbi:MAG TPA: hypothetical protein VNV41_03250 [Candidatus Acidoferrales bacterium]|jgi:hypothetical protein|nr:hypothetical protein [Candidatus Acidoferrales bacterium]
MASRREFLQIGVAALALPISARAGLAPAILGQANESTPTPLYKVIFDERFASSRAFADEVKRLGGSVYGIKGDITDLWFTDLDARWKREPVGIAGLTEHGPLFCLERLAWDHGMRVVYRADHTYRADGYMEHELSGSERMLREAVNISSSGPDWGNRTASLLTRCPASKAQASKMTVVTPTLQQADDPEHLVSWVIAPVGAARKFSRS